MLKHNLYIKTHNITGLKYLGYTIQDPQNYRGSGVYWRSHLKEHGNDVTTEIIGSYSDKKDMIKAGKFFSNLWNITESNEWANLKIEEGDGAASGEYNHMKLQKNRKKISQWSKKYSNRPEVKNKLRKRMLENNPAKRPDVREKIKLAKLSYWAKQRENINEAA